MKQNGLMPEIEIEKIDNMREDISDLFINLADFLNKLYDDLKNYKVLYSPFVNYFFPKDYKVCNECFMKDIVLPTKEKLNRAVKATETVLKSDDKYIEKISQGLSDVDVVAKTVNEMIELVEDVDLHFVNIMITSAKAKEEGVSLTTIAGQMGNLVENVKRLSSDFMEINSQFKNYLEAFSDSRESMLTIRELYLTNTQSKIENAYISLEEFLTNASSEINIIMDEIESVRLKIDTLIPQMQNEDIIRQDLEKIVFIYELLNNEELYILIEENERIRLEKSIFALIEKKISEILNTYNFIVEVSMSIQQIMLDDKLKQTKTKSQNDNSVKSKSKNIDIDYVYSEIQDIGDNLGKYIDVFTKEQQNIAKLVTVMEDLFDDLDTFFHKINVVIKKFETINMLTRIEIARTGNFSNTIEGSLDDVNFLPGQMKKKNSSAEKKYSEIDSYFGSSIIEYHNNIQYQSSDIEITKHIINSISSELFNSKIYYHEIIDNISKEKNSMKKYWNNHAAQMKKLLSYKKEMTLLQGKINNYLDSDSDTIIQNNRDLLEKLKNILYAGSKDGNYSYMMSRSLIEEMISEKTKSEITIF